MHFARIALVALLLLPGVAFSAGFAKQSLFLSKTPVTEGESVLIHTVVQNENTQTFDGSLVVFAQKGSNEKEKIGTVAVSIAPGGANTVSVSWKPSAGDYTVTAELTDKSDAAIETQTAHFSIKEKPKPAELVDQSNSEVQSSAEVQAMIAKFIPGANDIGKPFFETVDSLRFKAGRVLDQGISWSKAKVGTQKAGDVLGASAKNTTPQGLLGTASYLAGMISLYVFSVLKWIVANSGIFYPVLALGFLYTMWRVFAFMRRPRY